MLSRRPGREVTRLAPETGRSRLKRTVPSSSHAPFATDPDHDVANQRRDAGGVSQPRRAPLKGSAERIRPPAREDVDPRREMM